mgnify:CR=1 FL=1
MGECVGLQALYVLPLSIFPPTDSNLQCAKKHELHNIITTNKILDDILYKQLSHDFVESLYKVIFMKKIVFSP